MKSQAPEYRGSSDLPPPSDPQTLAAVAGEPLASASSNTPGQAPPATPVALPRLPGTPELTKDGLYAFSGGGLEVFVDPRAGNVVHLAVDGHEALMAPEPAPKVEANVVDLEGSTLVLRNSNNSRSKRFRLDTARRSFEIQRTFVNTTADNLTPNFSDVQRVPSAGGLTFFPGAPPLLPGSTLKLDVSQAIVWFAHEQAREPKYVAASILGSARWVATAQRGLLLVQWISDSVQPTISVGSAYDAASKQRPWVEVGISPQPVVSPGAFVTSTVQLFLRRLPSDLQIKSGNRELVGFVRGVIQ